MDRILISHSVIENIVGNQAAFTNLDTSKRLFIVTSIFRNIVSLDKKPGGGGITSSSSKVQIISSIFDDCQCGNTSNNYGGNAVFFMEVDLNFHQNSIHYCSKKDSLYEEVGDSPMLVWNPEFGSCVSCSFLNLSKNNGNWGNGQTALEMNTKSFLFSFSLVEGSIAARMFYIGCQERPKIHSCNFLNNKLKHFMDGNEGDMISCFLFGNSHENGIGALKNPDCISDDSKLGTIGSFITQKIELCNPNDIEDAIKAITCDKKVKARRIRVLSLSLLEFVNRIS